MLLELKANTSLFPNQPHCNAKNCISIDALLGQINHCYLVILTVSKSLFNVCFILFISFSLWRCTIQNLRIISLHIVKSSLWMVAVRPGDLTDFETVFFFLVQSLFLWCSLQSYCVYPNSIIRVPIIITHQFGNLFNTGWIFRTLIFFSYFYS